MYYDDNDGRRIGRWIGGALTIAAIAALGFYTLRGAPDGTLRASGLTPAASSGTTRLGSAADDLAVAPTTSGPFPTTPVVTTLTTNPPQQAAPTAEVATTTTSPATTTTLAPTVDPESQPAEATSGTTDLGYPAAPDGTPLPVIVTYDSGSVQLTGFVPSEAARERLVGLARANSQEADVEVTDNLLVNPAVPASVGVRVLELQSARFGEGEARLTPEHSVQFDRVVAVMKALPHVSVLVVGHADQRGGSTQNLALSESRAGAVVDYLTYLGVEPTRISMRGAGETDLLTLDDDSSALALNRRTEFIFFGVLV